jgi:hypothetical protein
MNPGETQRERRLVYLAMGGRVIQTPLSYYCIRDNIVFSIQNIRIGV